MAGVGNMSYNTPSESASAQGHAAMDGQICVI